MSKVDYYSILNISRGSTGEEISAAYRRLSKLYHPDVNPAPWAQGKMKVINAAYDVLRDEKKRQEYNKTLSQGRVYQGKMRTRSAINVDDAILVAQAREAMQAYFDMLVKEDYEGAYNLLSSGDKQHVDISSYCRWRNYVRRMSSITAYSIVRADVAVYTHSQQKSVKFTIEIVEKNSRGEEKTRCVKTCTYENDGWQVLLGYKDLKEIVTVYESLSKKVLREKELMRWREYQKNRDIRLDIFTMEGWLRESQREIYRYQRYSHPFTVGVYEIGTALDMPYQRREELMEICSGIISSRLRVTDISGYAGNGVFLVTLSEVNGENAEELIEKIADRIRHVVKKRLGMSIDCKYSFEAYRGGELAELIEKLTTPRGDVTQFKR